MTNHTVEHIREPEKGQNISVGVYIGVEILFILLYVATLLFVWFKRWFKTDDDVLTRHHFIHQKNLEQQQAAFEGAHKENYVQAPTTS